MRHSESTFSPDTTSQGSGLLRASQIGPLQLHASSASPTCMTDMLIHPSKRYNAAVTRNGEDHRLRDGCPTEEREAIDEVVATAVGGDSRSFGSFESFRVHGSFSSYDLAGRP